MGPDRKKFLSCFFHLSQNGAWINEKQTLVLIGLHKKTQYAVDVDKKPNITT